MMDEDLEEKMGTFFLQGHEKRCHLCEEGLYQKSLFHQCANEDSNRLDINFCEECDGLIYRVDNSRSDFPEELSCECEE